MSDRGLSASEIFGLERQNAEFYYLIKMDFATPVYYTLAPYDIDYSGDTYSSTGLVLKVPTITETLKIKPSTLSLEMSGSSSFVQALALSDNYNNADVLIYLYQPIENLLKYSEQFQNAVWIISGSGTVNINSPSVPAPDGTFTVDSLWDNDTASDKSYIQQSITIPDDSLKRTFTVYLYERTATETQIAIFNTGGTSVNERVIIDWATYTVDNGTIEAIGNGWYRVSASVENNGTNTTCIARIYPAGAVAGDTGNVYAWGAQLNNGQPKPYIKTEATAATPIATQIFEGLIGGCSTVENIGSGRSSVTWSVANHWSNWEDKNARLLNDAYQQSLFTGDKGLEYFGVTDYKLDYWGKWDKWKDVSSSGAFDTLVKKAKTKITGLASSDRKVFARDAGEPLDVENLAVPVLYGQRVIEGTPVFRDLTGSYNEYLHVVYVLAEGECDSLVDITFAGISYTDASISSYIDVHFHAGTDADVVDPDLDLRSSKWNSEHMLRGLCNVYIRYTSAPDDPWGGGEPVPLFELKGRKIWDPRTSTTIYSTNPAIVLRDYLSNTRIGKSIPVAKLSGVNDAADYCDVLETEHSGGAGTIKRLTFEGFLDTGVSIKKNVESILFAMRGHLPWANGLYYFIIERHDDTSAYSFDDSTTGDMFDVKPVAKLNTIHYKYVDLELEHQENTVISASATYKTEDNDRELKKAYFNKFENNQYRALNRASTMLKKSRENLRLSISSARLSALNLICGNVFDVTRDSKGWTAKEFRAEEIKIKPDGVIEFTNASEYESTVYDWSVSTEDTLPVNTLLPNPFAMEAPENLVLASGTTHQALSPDGTTINRMLVTWDHVNDLYKVDRFIVQYKESADTDYVDGIVINDVSPAVAGNGLLQSETLDVRWGKNKVTSISNNAGDDSTGSTTLDYIIEDTTLGYHYIVQNINSIITAFNQVFSVGVELEANTRTYAAVVVTTFSSTYELMLNLSTGVITQNTFPGQVTANIIQNSAGLCIVTIENIPSGSSGAGTRYVRLHNSNGGSTGDLIYTGTSQGVNAGRAQCNLGSKLLPYATTTTVAVEGSFYHGSMYIDNVTYNVDYDVRVAAYNGNNIKSDWLTGSHTVEGLQSLGYDVSLYGTDAYKNTSFYYATLFESLDNFNILNNAAIVSSGSVRVTSVTASPSYIRKMFNIYSSSADLTWTKNKKLKVKIELTDVSLTNGDIQWLTLGQKDLDSVALKSVWNNSTSKFDLYAFSEQSDGDPFTPTVTSTTSSLITSVSSGTPFVVEILYVTGTSVTIIIDDTYSQVITTNLAGGLSDFYSWVLFSLYVEATTGAGDGYVEMDSLITLQEA